MEMEIVGITSPANLPGQEKKYGPVPALVKSAVAPLLGRTGAGDNGCPAAVVTLMLIARARAVFIPVVSRTIISCVFIVNGCSESRFAQVRVLFLVLCFKVLSVNSIIGKVVG